MKEIKLSDGRELLVVDGLPVIYDNICIEKDGRKLLRAYVNSIDGSYYYALPHGNWKLLGNVSEIMNSEEKCKEVVEKSKSGAYVYYKDFLNNEGLLSVISSFKSFITAHSLNENDLLIVKI